MGKTLVAAFISLLSFGALSADVSSSISSLSKAIFPSISSPLLMCYQNFKTTISEDEREILNINYFKTAQEVLSGNYAPNLSAKFGQTLAPFLIDIPEFLRLLACARYITGNFDGKNYFIEANIIFSQFSWSLKEDLKKNIEKFYNGFGGDATTQEGKIAHINALIDILNRIINQKAFAGDLKTDNNIIKYILTKNGEERILLLNFAVAVAHSSKGMASVFVPPGFWDYTNLGIAIARDTFSGFINSILWPH